jgi:pimeloyl-ACP methyl ester carboxylesterase
MDLAALSRTIDANGLSFPCVDVGSGPPVLLLHGFPDSRFLWRHQIGPLADAGFRVIAPDLRGFGDAPRPADVADYRFPIIARDVTGILDALNITRVQLVGHDFGAALAWYLASAQPDRVERLVALSVGAAGTSGSFTLEQREKFWYFLFFQFEGIAEASLSRNDWRFFRQWTRGQGDTDRYVQDLARPGALTAALNWYRANVRPQMPSDRPTPGDRLPRARRLERRRSVSDRGTHAPVVERVTGPWRYEKIAAAGHWMMLDKPAELNRLLLEFLNR